MSEPVDWRYNSSPLLPTDRPQHGPALGTDQHWQGRHLAVCSGPADTRTAAGEAEDGQQTDTYTDLTPLSYAGTVIDGSTVTTVTTSVSPCPAGGGVLPLHQAQRPVQTSVLRPPPTPSDLRDPLIAAAV